MRILYISHLYDPEMGAQSVRVQNLSRTWVSMGHEVTVLTAFPNHPAGKIFPGWRHRFMKFVDVSADEGVKIVRVAHAPRPNRGTLNRLVGFSSFTLSAALASTALPRSDIVIGTVPQPLQPLAAWLGSRIRRSKFVLEVRDLWPEGLVATGQAGNESLPYRGLKRVASHLYDSADHVVAVTDSIRDHIVANWRVPDNKVDVVRAAVNASAFDASLNPEQEKQRWGQQGKFTVSYIGTLGNAHDLGLVLDAAALLSHTHPNVEFLFAGDGAEGPALRARAGGMGNVRFIGARPRTELPSIFSASDVCLAILRPDPLFTTVAPTKLYEYMAAGKPIISNVPGEASTLLEQADAGVSISPGDPSALVSAITRLVDDPARRTALGQNGATWVRANAIWAERAREYDSIFQRCVDSER